MPRRPSTPQSHGPGRGTPRTRTGSRRPAPAKTTGPSDDDVEELDLGAPAGGGRGRGVAQAILARSSLTTRAIALAVVMMVLVLSYASSLRVYVNQRSHISQTRQLIAERQDRIAGLQAEIGQWSDAGYVKAQARQRLGWVVPGETGYKVIDADGKPVGGGVEIESESAQPPTTEPAWWAKLWGSTKAADHPAPVVKKKEPKPITADSQPR